MNMNMSGDCDLSKTFFIMRAKLHDTLDSSDIQLWCRKKKHTS